MALMLQNRSIDQRFDPTNTSQAPLFWGDQYMCLSTSVTMTLMSSKVFTDLKI